MKETDTAAPASTTRSIDLRYPVTLNGMTCARLEVRRPKVRDLVHAAKQGGTDAEQEVSQFASLTGQSPKLIEELDVADYLAVQKVVKSFLS